MFLKPKNWPHIEIEWDDRKCMTDGTTGRIRKDGVTVEFEQHRTQGMVRVSNGPLFYGEEWYTVGPNRFISLEALVKTYFPVK